MPRRNKRSAVADYLIGGGAILIFALLIFPWWIAIIWFGVCCFFATLDIAWWRTPKDLRKRLIKAEWEFEKARRDNLAARLKASEEEIARLRGEKK